MHKRIKAIVLWPPPWSQKTLIGRLAAYAYALMVSPLVLAISILSASAYFFAARASRNLTKHEVANTLERFVKNSGEAWEWDDFINGSALRDEALERIRIQCKQLPLIHPPLEGHGYCGAQGLETMKQLVIELRGRVQ